MIAPIKEKPSIWPAKCSCRSALGRGKFLIGESFRFLFQTYAPSPSLLLRVGFWFASRVLRCCFVLVAVFRAGGLLRFCSGGLFCRVALLLRCRAPPLAPQLDAPLARFFGLKIGLLERYRAGLAEDVARKIESGSGYIGINPWETPG